MDLVDKVNCELVCQNDKLRALLGATAQEILSSRSKAPEEAASSSTVMDGMIKREVDQRMALMMV